MDADSSYGGSDTAQDSHSGHDNSSSLETTHNDVTHQQEPNNFYHKNEITLPVNYDETDFQDNKPIKQPHYLSTANLNINDTLEHHSNLEEMSKNYKSTSYLNESPKTINKSDVGVDNPAFQEEEYKPEVKSTFDHNKPYNGDLNSSAILGLTSPNKNEEPLTEAVNLELINLKPVGKDVTGAYENGNGMTSIPVKKESDAEIGNPYDEYFVPVNEHRKYMRGEKLYVTMDKRNKKKRNKCLCWGLCLCIVAAAVIIGILAAVGVIGNQGPHPAQEVSARHFGSSSSEPEVKTGGIFGLPKEVTQETTIPPETSSRFTPGPPVVTVSNLLPTTETSMIQVPRALESQLVIDNLQFTPALADKNSTEFKKLAEALETELKNSLFSSDTLNYGASNIEVKIVDFTPGSVVVKYRITWVFKDGIHGAKDPIDEEMLKKKMKNILNRNNGFMDTYHIDDNTVSVERILDLCKIENNGCEYNCSFDYEIADFVCSCPEGKYLGSDRKSCMDETVIEPKNINFHEDDLYATENPHFVQEPSSEPEPTSVPDYHHHENEASPEPEPTSEPITEPKPTEIHHIIINEPSAEPEPTSEPVAEPKPTEIHHIINEPAAEPEPTSEPITEGKPTETHHNIIVETSPEPEPTIKPTETHYHIIAEPSAEPEPTSEPEPEPTNKPEEVSHENYINLHELEVVPIPTTEPNVEPHSEPTSEPNPEPTAEPAAEPNAEPTAEPAAEPTLVPIAEPSPEPTAEPAAEPNPEPTAEPAAEPSPEPNAVPAAEPTAEPAAEPSPETTIQPIAEPSPEPTAEPASEPELKPIVGLIPESTSPEPTPEPKTEPITESNPEPTVLPKLNPEPASQPNPEPTTEVIEPKSEPVSEHITEFLPEFAIEHRTEPVAEPTPESVIIHTTEPITEVRTEHPTENKSEPVAEPTAEPNLDHKTTSSATLTEHVSENKIEFASEPNTEHTIQPEMKMEITTQMVNHEINLTSEPNIEPSPVPIVPHVNPLIIETTTKLENEDSISSTESMTISPMTVSPMTSSSMSPTTMKSTESEFRHNHLSEEIFAEPEITTMTNQQVEEVSKTTTIKNNESNTIENSVTTSVPNVEVKEEAVPTTLLPIFEVKEETPVTTSLPASEIKENSPITTTTVASEVHPTTSVSNSEAPVTTTVTSMVKMDEKITTTKPEMTTQPTLIETTINNQNHSENIIPVSVNEQTYHLVHSQNTTEESVTNPVTVPMIFNNEHVILHSDNVEVKNETSKPDMVETTPSSTDMSKIFTEIHKVMDDNFDHSTEMVAVEGTNHTHMNMGVMDSTENTSAMDNMSPFLPELGNDTFVNKLHLGEHIIPPIQNETHDDEIIETSPPRLDNDQMNVTNPKDSNPTDTPLQVVPLEGTENEIVDKEISTQTPKSEEKMKVTEPQFVPVMVIQEATPTTTMSSVNLLESIKDNATENSIEITTKSLDSVKIESTTKSSEEIVKTTLPPEIINNVHSNNYFETLLQPHHEENATSSQSPQQNILTSFSTSTEDLIALETTTNGGKMAENKNVGVETTTETSKRNESITTVHAEILTTVRESVNFANNTDENSTKVVDSTATATKTDEANITKAEESNSTIIEDNNLTISAEVTTVPSPQNKSHQYEVQETFSDVTTTEKLFLSTKATTEVPVIIKEAYEDLSVVPLNSDDDNETSKIEEKRVAPTTTFGQLDAEPNDSTNDISQEEQSVLEKFHHNFNEINGESDKSEDSTTSKVDEISESNTELGHELFKYDTYNETKLKKNKDKAKFDKKAKLEKAISANDEILTTSLPSDKQPAPFSDVKPVTEDFTISGFSRCVFGQFQCINGTNTKDGSYCISVNDRCDSVDDCSDASDEIDCIKNGCPNNFQCDSGQCLKRHLVCDGIQHCNDGSDETNCDQWNCRFDEFSCGEKLRCIPVSWKCDGRMQCPNGSDEYNCPSTICNENSFHCLEQNTCVPKSWMCDGKADCVNAEDEKSCECGNDEFKCAIGGGCIKTHQRCDGTDDCADRSDEWKCMRLEEMNNKKYLQIEFSNNTWFPVCSDNWNQTHSDLVCRNLGYGGSSLTETVAKPDGDFKGYFKLKNQLTYGSPILSQIEKSDNCDNFISISCQEFTCGSQSTLDVQSARIIGGNRGTETQWPSLTLLYNKKHNIQCTATLIAPLWVMASHSCIFNPFSQNPNKPKDWILYAGNTNFFSNHDNSTTQVGQIKHIFAHPQAKFSQFDFANDVVLVELVKPLTMTRNVSAMCLPDKDIEPRQLCIIAGWGVSKPGEPGKNQYLHYLPVPIIDLDGCNSTKHYNGLISKGKICAGYTDSEKTPCYNDEGAPLMCFSDSAGTWELQGILSHHDNCARSKHPAIYTAINEKIRQWVINTIGQKPARSA